MTALREFDAWRDAMGFRLAVHGRDVQCAAFMLRHFELGLRAPDAIYVAAALRLDLPLVTFDETQARGALALGARLAAPGLTDA